MNVARMEVICRHYEMDAIAIFGFLALKKSWSGI